MRSTSSARVRPAIAACLASVVLTLAVLLSPPAPVEVPPSSPAVAFAPLDPVDHPAGVLVAGTCVHLSDALDAVLCVPSTSPGGAPVLRIGEDGSAGYADGWAVDPDGADGDDGAVWVRPGVGFRVE